MSYQVLARKWRPRSFKDMVGQEPILRMLENALAQKRIHHAYLFTGTRGVGKTTLARIFAKCLNCETGITPTPCDQCPTCLAIDAGQFLDLLEIDAASRTKVEDTRELLEGIPYPPSQGRYKVYLLDEIHMLSNHSCNALLKTLEEPPEHVKFLFATTDPKRLPITILSRCLQFHLKRILPEQIAQRLAAICATENITHEFSALQKLAKSADGSMRDALSLLDQAIAYGDGTVNTSQVHTMLGSTALDDLLPLIEALAAQDGKQLFLCVQQLAERVPNFQQVLEELIDCFHRMALAQCLPDRLAADDSLAPLVKRFSAQDLQLYYQIALLGRRDLLLSPHPQQGFEMTMLRMLAFTPIAKTAAQPVTAVTTTKTASVVAAVKEKTKEHIDNTPPHPQPSPAVVSVAAATTTAATLAIDWRDLLPKLNLSGMAYALASNCVLEKATDQHITLSLSIHHQPMLNDKLKERIKEALNHHFGHVLQLDIQVTQSELKTPVKQQQQEFDQRLAGAKETVMQNPQIKKLVDMYDATVEVSILS
ncbi:MAG TPA: DNA polymerase III subunit gamma/tau [Gammaproteobacteria bacterium]|jgi:DNA polymerase-3 subunit gamma/tau|nr:DNA polymerase III subunit gamma/tau [Gammaproteobacteria bacterium]